MRITKLSYAISLALGTCLLISQSQELDLSSQEYEEACMRKAFTNPEFNTRQGITYVEKNIRSFEESTGADPYPLIHTFHGGTYTRELKMPKGCFLVGKLHATDYSVYVMSGRVLVANEWGTNEIIAPERFNCKAGTKSILYILEDTVWIDIYKTDATDVESAEKELISASYEEFDMLSSEDKGDLWLG